MKTVTKEELVRLMAGGSVTVVNVLKKETYDKIHIDGSASMPRAELEAGRWQELDRRRTTVVHCSSYSCGASKVAAEFLEAKGFDARTYEGGMQEWAEAGLPTQGQMTPRQYLEERAARQAALSGISH
ncbi:MAG: rhodanese-like domain-containing protein [Thaumarchaeota archaeon]|nr:rhodanese-like domain-containing protein [Nitrososphaerota archaeon]